MESSSDVSTDSLLIEEEVRAFDHLYTWQEFLKKMKGKYGTEIRMYNIWEFYDFLNQINLFQMLETKTGDYEKYNKIKLIVDELLEKHFTANSTKCYDEILGNIESLAERGDKIAYRTQILEFNVRQSLLELQDWFYFDIKDRDRFDFTQSMRIKQTRRKETMTILKLKYCVDDYKELSAEYLEVAALVMRNEKDIVEDIKDVQTSEMILSLDDTNICKSPIAFIMNSRTLSKKDLFHLWTLFLTLSAKIDEENRFYNRLDLLRYILTFITCVLDRMRKDSLLDISEDDFQFLIKESNHIIDGVPFDLCVVTVSEASFIYDYCCNIRYLLSELCKDHATHESVISNFIQNVYRMSVCRISVLFESKNSKYTRTETNEFTIDYDGLLPFFFKTWFDKITKFNGASAVIEKAATDKNYSECPVCFNDFVLDVAIPGNMLLLSQCPHVICRICYVKLEENSG